jgi:hypothetical protein
MEVLDFPNVKATPRHMIRGEVADPVLELQALEVPQQSLSNEMLDSDSTCSYRACCGITDPIESDCTM